jgi:hypothetical protein
MVSESNPAFLRREAALYRRLVHPTTDDRTRTFLTELADELDGRAAVAEEISAPKPPAASTVCDAV